MKKKTLTKKPIKKAAKKAPAKPKLLDGKYAQKILLRLIPEHSEALSDLKKTFNEKTDAVTIYKAITGYSKMQKENTELRNKLNTTESNLSGLKYNVGEFKDAFNNLFEDEKAKDIDSDQDDDEEDNQYCQDCFELHEDCEC